MVDVGTLYLAVSGALLLVALGVGFRVLRGIAREGRDRQHRRRAGEAEERPEEEERGQVPAVGPGDDRGESGDPDEPSDADRSGDRSDSTATCPACGAANEPEFSYCRRCAASLGPGP